MKLENEDFLSKIKVPTIIFHGTADEVIPYEIGRKVFTSMEPQTTKLINSGGHKKFQSFFTYWNELDDWMAKLIEK